MLPAAVLEFAPDVVVLDITMPGLGGTEAVRTLAESKDAPKIVILSVHKDQDLMEAVLAAGASAYVVKTSAGDELVPAIRAVLRGRTYISRALRGSSDRP